MPIKSCKFFDPVRGDARFLALFLKINLEPRARGQPIRSSIDLNTRAQVLDILFR
jgi:hypothetical protein